MERILYAGDSTVAFNKINTYPQTGMSQALPLYLKDNIQVISFAKNGRSTRSFIAEGRLAAIEKEIKKGDYLFVQFGHNDSKADKARHTDPDTDFKENLRMFAETAKACGAKAVFITPIARRLFDENGTFKPGSHGAYPRAMKEAAKEAGVPVVDLTTVTEQYLAQVGELWSRSLFVWPKDRYDGRIPCRGPSGIGRAIQQPSGRGEGGAVKWTGIRRWSAALQPVIKSMGSTLYGCFWNSTGDSITNFFSPLSFSC